MVIVQSCSSPPGYPQQQGYSYGGYQQQGYMMHPQQPQAQYPTDHHQYYGYYANQYAPQVAPNPCISTIPPPPRPPPPPPHPLPPPHQQYSNHHMTVNGSGYNQSGTPGYGESQFSYDGGSGGGKVKPTAYGGYGYGYGYQYGSDGRGTQPYQTHGHNPAGQGYNNVYYSIKKVD